MATRSNSNRGVSQNSTNGSSSLTLSPLFFSHLATVASVTDSPRVGTKIGELIIQLSLF